MGRFVRVLPEDITVRARLVLHELWMRVQCRGRCWGLKRGDNPYKGTNITLFNQGEAVTICKKENKMVIHEFKAAKVTKLGNEVRRLLKINSVEYEE